MSLVMWIVSNRSECVNEEIKNRLTLWHTQPAVRRPGSPGQLIQPAVRWPGSLGRLIHSTL
jgi:hypothetical protein